MNHTGNRKAWISLKDKQASWGQIISKKTYYLPLRRKHTHLYYLTRQLFVVVVVLQPFLGILN